jgi:hypothetical protein
LNLPYLIAATMESVFLGSVDVPSELAVAGQAGGGPGHEPASFGY